MKTHLLVSLLVIFSGCTAAKKAQCAVRDTAIPMDHSETTEMIHQRVTLDNGVWKLALIPSTMGGFDRFYSEKHPENLFGAYPTAKPSQAAWWNAIQLRATCSLNGSGE